MKKRLNEWVYEWLETYKKVMVKPSTYDSYLQYATHVTCDKSLKKLSSSDIQKLINNMVVEGLKLSTIKHMLTLVRQSLKKARSLGFIKSLVCLEDLDLPKKQPKKITPLRPDEINKILKNSYLTFTSSMVYCVSNTQTIGETYKTLRRLTVAVRFLCMASCSLSLKNADGTQKVLTEFLPTL